MIDKTTRIRKMKDNMSQLLIIMIDKTIRIKKMKDDIIHNY